MASEDAVPPEAGSMQASNCRFRYRCEQFAFVDPLWIYVDVVERLGRDARRTYQAAEAATLTLALLICARVFSASSTNWRTVSREYL